MKSRAIAIAVPGVGGLIVSELDGGGVVIEALVNAPEPDEAPEAAQRRRALLAAAARRLFGNVQDLGQLGAAARAS